MFAALHALDGLGAGGIDDRGISCANPSPLGELFLMKLSQILVTHW